MLFGTSFGLVELHPNGTTALVKSEEGKFVDEVLCVSEARNGGLWILWKTYRAQLSAPR